MTVKKEFKKRYATAMPDSAFEPAIELVSNKEAMIEGCSGIVEYNDTLVTVNCKKITVSIEGTDINLKTLASDIIEVTGTFSNISFSML